MCDAYLCAAYLPLYLYPFISTESRDKPHEYLRLSSLGAIGALVKVYTYVWIMFSFIIKLNQIEIWIPFYLYLESPAKSRWSRSRNYTLPPREPDTLPLHPLHGGRHCIVKNCKQQRLKWSLII